MKKLITICLLFLLNFSIKAQTAGTVDCDCPTPKGGKFLNFCTLVENQDSRYKKELLQMSCVDLIKDSPETIKAKLQCMWKKYYAEFGCDDIEFLVAQGNILKYAINQEFELFVDGVSEIGLDINLKDPADGNTLLDFVLDEVERYKKYPDFQNKTKELQEIYDHLKFDLYALHASELTTKPHYQWGVKITLGQDILKRYVGKFSLQMDTVQFLISITLDNGKLFLSENNKKANELFAETDRKFFSDSNPNSYYEFILNSSTGKYDLTYEKYQAKRLD